MMHELLSGRDGRSRGERIVTLLCVSMSLFHMYTAGIGLLETAVQRAVHLGFAMTLVFLLHPFSKPKGVRAPDLLFAALSVVCTGYIALFFNDIAMRGGKALPHDILLGALAMLLVLEAGRRVLGRTLPALALLFLLYCVFGRYAPSIFAHRGYSAARIIQHMYLTPEGIFGVALGVSSTFVFMFILFGSLLSAGGGARFFNDLALALSGRSTGGPAKVAILASGLLGTINGSSVANVATTGTFTIPLMKKTGYTPEDAGAIEACASTGGQLLPPIMGAGAFIMSEFLSVPYARIVAAATIPALLYYGAILANVHLRARRENIGRLDPNALPRALDILKRDGHLLLPIAAVVFLLLRGYTPLMAAFRGILCLMAVCALRRHTRFTMRDIVAALEDGAKNALGTAIACAVVGFIVGTTSLTALGFNLSGNIVDFAGGALLPTLLLSMAACLLLGMGLPTTANYIVTSTIIVPVLLRQGVPALPAHLFVFYFGIMADITPPVCLASFTAAGIAEGRPAATGIAAAKLILPAYLLPYAFIYSPAILLQHSGFVEIAAVVLFSAVGILALAAASQGYIFSPTGAPSRILSAGAGFLCFIPGKSFPLFGVLLFAALAFGSFRRSRVPAKNEHAPEGA